MASSSLNDFEEAVRAAVDPVALPSLAYGISRGGETLLQGASGLADKAGIAASSQTPYALASVTKPMTGTAVAMLAERGLVDLDAPIERYLGGMRLDGKAGDPDAATVRRVADHTAGLPLHYRFYYADEGIERRPFEEVVARHGKLFARPGERHLYSNLGYGLLDALLSNVSRKSYARFMAEEIFGPLGMAATSIGPPSEAAVGYGPDGVAYPPYDTDHPGGSAAFSTVEDLLAFGRFHLGGGPAIVSSAGRLAMQEPTLGYGLGWGVAERHGRRIVGHTGGMGGVATVLRLVPELELVVAVVANGEGGAPSRLADEAIAALDARFREGLRADRSTSPKGVASSPMGGFEGIWSGAIELASGRLPFALELGRREPLVRLDGREGFLSGFRTTEACLYGEFEGALGVREFRDRPYRVHLDLPFRNGRLEGAATAVTWVPHPGGARDKRLGSALSYWVKLERI